MFNELEFLTILIMLFALVTGGLLKGIISFGFPLIALPVLTLILPVKSAIFLLFFPVIFLNIFEINVKNFYLYKKIIPLMLGVFLGIIVGSIIFHKVENEILSKAIGFTIVFFALIYFFEIKINPKWLLNKTFSFFYGNFAGLIGGMTTILGPLIIIY